MKISSHRLAIFLALFIIPWVMLINLPSAQAYESTKIVLPAVSDKSGYNSPELNAALLTKLRSQFRFPKYETLLTATLTGATDRTTLEKITTVNDAEGAATVEISFLRNRIINSLFNEETYEETDLVLTLTYFDKKTGQYGQFKANRYSSQVLSVSSGPLPLAVEALEELLNHLDKIFPRQFPGPRY